MKKVENIAYPYIFTDTKERLHVMNFSSTKSLAIGANIDEIDGKYEVVGKANIDENCIGGACPIR